MTRRSARTWAVATTAGIALAVTAFGGSAHAAGGSGLSLSTDGSTYSSTLTGSLFGGLGVIVPLQHEAQTIWVRNDTSATAVLRVNAVGVTADDIVYGDALTLSAATTQQIGAAAMPFSTSESCFLLLGEQYVPAGTSVPVTFTLAMADVDGRTAQGATAGATLVVQLRDAAAPAPADGACDGDGTHLAVLGADPARPTAGPSIGSLSSTGADPLLWVLAAFALVTGGWVAIASARRGKREES